MTSSSNRASFPDRPASREPSRQRVSRVVADLLEPGQSCEDEAAALHAIRPLGCRQELVDDRLVHGPLLLGERRPGDLLDLVGEVGHERLVGLGTAKYERSGQGSEPSRDFQVLLAFDRGRPPVPELGLAAEQARHDHIENGPELAEAVLDRCAGECQLLGGGDSAHRLGRFGVGVLDGLGLVEHQCRPGDPPEFLGVASHQTVRRDHEVVLGHGGFERGTAESIVPVMHEHPHERCEPRRFGLPVAHHAERTHHEVWARSVDEVGEGGRGLAEAHVVGETPAEPELGQELEPAQPAPLVGPEGGFESWRLVPFAQRGVGQPRQQRSNPARRRFPGLLGGDVVAVRGEQFTVVVLGRLRCQPHERRGVDLGVVAAVPGELLESLASRRRIEADPLAVDLEQRCAGRDGPFERGVADLVLVDHHRPGHERCGAEPALARLCRGTSRATDLGRDGQQLTRNVEGQPQRLQLLDPLQERGGADHVEIDARRCGRGGPRGDQGTEHRIGAHASGGLTNRSVQ